MKAQYFFAIGIIVVASSAVSNCLAIGFEVDTPLDPFLGGLSKIKRHLVRRIKEFGTDENFLNAPPIDQLNMLFGQRSGLFSPFVIPGQSPQFAQQNAMINQRPLSAYEQRKSAVNEIPIHLIQQLDAQLAQLNIPVPNSQAPKTLNSFPSCFGLRQLPGLIHQFTQAMPGQITPQLPGNLRQRYV